MLAARKPSGKSAPEMFDDVPVLQRKWQAALRPSEKLPAYEDVMLGSLGRLADHIILLKEVGYSESDTTFKALSLSAVAMCSFCASKSVIFRLRLA